MTPILIGTDYLVYLADDSNLTTGGLFDNSSNTYVNNADSATAKLYSGSTQVGTTITLTYVAASNGVYRGTIPAATTTTLQENQRYTIRFFATVGQNKYEQWENVHAEHFTN